jgi:hypothetical protein
VKIPLSRLAHARSGDKGDTANIAVIAWDAAAFNFLTSQLTAERVATYFASQITGPVERFEAPNLMALNFILRGALGGGGTVSLRTDAQGKTLAAALMNMEVECELDVPSDRP